MKDEHDEASERLLPCMHVIPDCGNLDNHHFNCPASLRPAVAAALRAQAEAHKAEVERLLSKACPHGCFVIDNKARFENDDLRAQLATAKAEVEWLEEQEQRAWEAGKAAGEAERTALKDSIEDLERQLATAKLDGLRAAKEIAREIAVVCEQGAGEDPPGQRCRQIERRIQQLIDAEAKNNA